jgi:hypothetical protein
MEAKQKRSNRFPRTQIQRLLANWWDEITTSSIRRPQNQQRVRQCGGTVFDIQPAISAAQTVEALLRVEPLLGFTPGIHLLRRDGYNCKKEFVDDLSLRLESEFRERIRRLSPPLKG